MPYGLHGLKCLSSASSETRLLTWSTEYDGCKVRDAASKAHCPCRPVSRSRFGCPGSSAPIPALDRDQRPPCPFAHQARSFWHTCG